MPVLQGAEFDAKHPRAAHGRFGPGMTKPKLLKRDERALGEIGPTLRPHSIGSPEAAAEYTSGHRRRIRPETVGAFHELAGKLRRGDTSDERIGKLDAAMEPTAHDLILTRHVPAAAFGLKNEDLNRLPELLNGRKIIDKAYTPAALHQEPQSGGITLRIAVPKGTRALVAGDNEMWLDRNQELGVVNVTEGRGGYTVLLAALPKAGTEKPRTAEGKRFDQRVKKAVSGDAVRKATPYVKNTRPPEEKVGDHTVGEIDRALDYYVRAGYLGVNNGLRTGHRVAEEKETIDAVDAAMAHSHLKRDIVVTRGIKNAAAVFGDKWNDDDVTGLEWTDKAYTSTSTTMGQGSFFTGSDGVLMRILVPKGTPALTRSTDAEGEVILGRDMSFRVVADNGVKGGIRQLDVEVVPKAATESPIPNVPADTPGVRDYQHYGLYVNDRLRGQLKDQRIPKKQADQITRDLDGQFDKVAPLKQPVTVYRGLSEHADFANQQERGLFGDADPTGKVFTDKGFQSASLDRRAAEAFAGTGRGRTVLELTLPAGSKALRPAGNLERENEALLPRGLSYKVTGERYEGDLRVLSAEVVTSARGTKKAAKQAASAKAAEGYGLHGPVKDTETVVHRALAQYHRATAEGRHGNARVMLKAAVEKTGNKKLAASLAAEAAKAPPADDRALDIQRRQRHTFLANRHENAAREQTEAAVKTDLARWRADAARPGRITSGRTKREQYVESWQEAIDRIEAEIVQARARGDNHRISQLEKDLKYNTSARDAIAANPDPAYDEVEATGGKLAQVVDPNRPLAVYGDMLNLDGRDDQWVHLNATNLEQIPAELHGKVAEQMAAKSTGGFWIGEGSVADLNHSADLHGEKPRGWNDDHTFDDVNGVYRPSQRIVIVGRTANSASRGARTTSHEFGHALDHALGNRSMTAEWQAIHDEVLAKADYRLSPYFKQPGDAGLSEFWAEAFQVWTEARKRSADQRAKLFEAEFGVPAAIASRLLAYFDRIARENGVSA